MKPDPHQKHSVQKANSRLHQTSVLLFLLAFVCSSPWLSFLAEATERESDNVQLGKLSQPKGPLPDFGASFSPQDGFRLRTTRLSSVAPRREQNHQQPAANGDGSTRQSVDKSSQIDDPVSSDCTAKRNEVLRRHSSTTPTPGRLSTTSLPAGSQRLQPKNFASSSTTSPSLVLNETIPNNFDGEHVPRCRPDGSYEPVQCHKIGYCWCVNKFGQAIKNSAVMSGEEPFCEPAMYESDSNDFLVVAGISAQRMRNFLKQGGSPVESTTQNGHINFEASGSSTETSDADGVHQQVESGKKTGSIEPTMPLIPNNCELSRINARERASKFVNDSIWVPECDKENAKFYAERQCHRTRVCWCVDQSSGLPLRTSDQLVARADDRNCTEIKRFVELANASMGGKSLKVQPAFYRGSSEFCDADKRIDFVVSLNNQFRQQINEYVRQNPSTPVPPDVSSSNPMAISEMQVSRWKFSIMDKDLDGRLGDREWSKFKNNFKLVDKADELDNPFKLQKSPYFLLTPLLIVRSQRKCWRDFLEFCGNGDLVDESISLLRWLSCTEVPPKSLYEEQQNRRHGVSSLENTYAHSREAAIVRSKKRNPFLGILKPD